MGFGLAARAEQRGDQQPPEPGAVLQRRDPVPGIEREGGGENRRQGRSLPDNGAPVGQAVLLVPVEIVDQRIAGFLPHRGAGGPLPTAADGGLDGGEGVRKQPLRATLRRETVARNAVAGAEAVVQARRGVARVRLSVRVPLPCPAAQLARPPGSAPSRGRWRRCGGGRGARPAPE